MECFAAVTINVTMLWYMRTTLNLDGDVAALLKLVQKRRDEVLPGFPGLCPHLL